MSQCAYSLDGASWTDLPVGPQFDLGIGVDEQNTEILTDGGAIWTERLFERDLWNLTFKIETSNIPAFQALHDAVDGQLSRLFITLDRTADPIIAIYGWKEAGFALEGTGERVQPPLFNYRLSISGETMSTLALLRSYEFDELPAAPAAGALARVSDAPGGLWMYSGEQWIRVGKGVNVKDAPFNATGDGATDDTAAFAAAAAYGNIYAPEGTYILTGLELVSGCTLSGDGQGLTILKAKTGEGLVEFVHIGPAESNITIRDLSIDGNRAGGGMVNAFSGAVYIEGSNVSLIDCEVYGGQWAGIFIGSDSVTTENTNISRCYIHDNGGATDDTGNGIGVLSGGILSGIISPRNIRIAGCHIKNNYNITTKPNDSSAINLTVDGCTITNNHIEDNFNVNGGQVVVWGYPDQTGSINAVINNNNLIMTTTFGTPVDRTGGIEIQGRNFTANGNNIVVKNADFSGISLGGTATEASGHGTIIGNHIDCAGGNGIDLDAAGLSMPATNVTIQGNVVVGAVSGIATNAADSNIVIVGNDLSGCGQPFAGTISSTTLIQGNLPATSVGRVHVGAISLPSAAHMTMGNSNVAEITGTTDIELLDSTGWENGDIVTWYFTDTLTVKASQTASGAYKQIKLDAGADFIAGPFACLQLLFNSVTWEQVTGVHNV